MERGPAGIDQLEERRLVEGVHRHPDSDERELPGHLAEDSQVVDVPVVRPVEANVEAVRKAGLREQGAGAGPVGLPNPKGRVETDDGRGNELRGRDGLPVVRPRHELVPIEREVDGLANPRVRERRLRHPESQEQHAEARTREDADRLLGPEGVHALEGDLVHDVDPAGEEPGDPVLGIRDDLETDPSDRGPRTPVVVVPLQREAAFPLPRGEPVGAGADQGNGAPGQRPGGQDVAPGQLVEQEGIRSPRPDHEPERPVGFDRCDVPEIPGRRPALPDVREE